MTSPRTSWLCSITDSPAARGLARLLIVSLLAQLCLLGELVQAAPHAPASSPVGIAGLASAISVFGPKDYVRGTGKPVVVTDTFSMSTPATFTLRIQNGGSRGQYGLVSSAVVTLNGVVVVGPAEFNPHTAIIEKAVALGAVNTLSVEVRSGPGTGFTLLIFGEVPNRPPVADAGPDQTAHVGRMVTLDGSRSSDPDGDPLTFAWTIVSLPIGSAARLSDRTAVRPTFIVDLPGTYEFELTVSDGRLVSAPDRVLVTTTNAAPIANAGPDQTAPVGATVTLDGHRSSDPDGDPLTFRWTIQSSPAGSIATLSDPTAVTPTFILDRPGTYVVQLVVNDGFVDSAPATVRISTLNSAPVADAGPAQTVFVGTVVTLDGSRSHDADGDALTFRWALTSQPLGSTATLSDPTAVKPTFTVDKPGTYVAQLTVNDGTIDSAPATVTISTTNSPPVANAGPAQSVFVGTLVTLDGSRSHDVDGDTLSFSWAFTSRPTGSAAALSNPTVVGPTFTVDLPGTYVVQLTVNDGKVDSAPATVTITTLNSAPVADAGPDQTVFVGTLVTLDGSRSHDADHDPLRYRWSFVSRPAASAAVLSDAAAINPTFFVDAAGTYVVQLIVNDGTVDSAPATVTITTLNSKPVAKAGPAQTVTAGDTVTLDGTASSDADHDPLTFRWAMLSTPLGSTATLSNPTAAKPTFVADVAGTYLVQLIVNDGHVDSNPDTTTVNARAIVPNVVGRPEADARAAIVAAKLVVGAVTSQNSDTTPKGNVISESPAAGSLVDAGSAVDLVVSAGPAMSIVPDVTGLTQTDASAALIAVHLTLGAVTTEHSDTVPEGKVIRQSPAAGTSVPPSSAVDVVISLGPAVPVLRTIAVTPANQTLARGKTQQYTATATFSDGHTENVTAAAKWESTNTPSVSITATGLATALDPGASTIRATVQGVSGTTTLTVTPSALSSIVVKPADPIALVGDQRLFTATGVLTDGTSQALTGVIWDTTDPAVATIDATGLATARGAGPATVRATKDGVTGTTSLTVQPRVSDSVPPVASITAPANGSVLTARTDVTGSATDANFSSYALEFAPAGTSTFTAIATGASPVSNGVLGSFDPTLLMNDQYTVRLTVFDRGGNTSVATTTYQVARDQKVGTFTLRFTDLRVPVAGLPIQVMRVYDSRDKRQGEFGIGWSLELATLRLTANRVQGTAWQTTVSPGFFPNFCVTPTDQHKISITLADGKVEEFDAMPNPQCQILIPPQFGTLSYTARPGTLGTLVPLDASDYLLSNPGGGPTDLLDLNTFDLIDPHRFQYTAKDGRIYVIDKTAGVQSVTDPNGNRLTIGAGGVTHTSGASIAFVRDAQNRITQITDPKGNVLRYAYDANADLATYTDAAGNTTRYLYNLSHGLLEIRDPLGRRPIRNEYDDAGRLVAHIDAEGQRVEYTHDLNTRQDVVQDRNGFLTVYEYDAQGNVIAITDPAGSRTTFTYDARGNRLSATDALGQVTTYTYDAQNNLLTESRTGGGLSSTIGHTYNSHGKVLTTTDPLGGVTTNTYDAKDNLLTTTDPAGGVTKHEYDPVQGNELKTTDPLGNVTTFTYDASGNMLTKTDASGTTTFTYDANGNKVTETDPRGGVTRFTYDALNRLVAVQDPLGAVTRKEYDAAGTVIAEVDAVGGRTTFTYDEASRLVQIAYADGTTMQFAYDAEGNRIATTDQLNRVTQTAFDGRKKVTQITLPDGSVQRFSYDLLGRRIAQTDARGNTSRAVYDVLGRQVQTIDQMGRITIADYNLADMVIARTDPKGQVTRFAYDANNRLTQTTLPGGQTMQVAYDAAGRKTAETDAAGRVTRFAYDAVGRLTQVTDAAGGVTKYEYDAAGNRTAVVDARGNQTTFAYDLAGRQTTRTRPNGGVETFTYDAAGRPATRTDAIGRTTRYTYDPRGRMVNRTYPDASTVQFSYTPTGKRLTATDARGTTAYTYDARDRLTRLQYPDGQAINYAYDAESNFVSISSLAGTIAYIHDNSGRLQQVTDPAGRATTYTYDAAGNRTALTYANGASVAYAYDANSRLTQLTHAGPAGALAAYTYTLGPTGNRTRIDETTGTIKSYTYDVLDRLTGEQVTDLAANPSYQNTFTYDAVGNRTTRTLTPGAAAPATTTYMYNAADQLVTETGVSYAYDLNGNLTSRTDAGGATTYEYDFDNRLLRLTLPSGVTTSYLYDVDGNRVEKRDASGTVRYLVDTNRQLAQVLAEYTPAGVLAASYVYGRDLISQTRGGQTAFFHFDGGGSTRLLTDPAGAITDTFEYDAFGNLIGRTGATQTDFLFNGQQFDANAGFYYLRARFYQPTTGRFISRDPIEGDLLNPITLHKYLYAGCDPVNKSDPSGQFLCVSTLAWGRFVHSEIGADFTRNPALDRLSDQTINTVLRANVPGGSLRPDLVDRDTNEVYEIKPTLSVPLGVAQMAAYLFVLNRYDPQGRWWFPGFSYLAPPVINIAPGVQALVFPPVGGIIEYCVINWNALFALIALALMISVMRPMIFPSPAFALAF